ncbi:hypothetical protein [Mesomycoplasma hyopneumoniae]|uniref:Transposase n=1 Tax=Mesomycoplasma hyopneumoniae TaxID=2099 RepID=A0ABD4SVX8_MESHO|nr:hypothetical protein [Mesomycoplasma hyopneumoniae]MCI8283260.1 hypothetical protein [Mesomycoplasma hyopneumoniae]MCI8298192.1 hypothetical protein [Mesomycoplasma hyopneumoniae]
MYKKFLVKITTTNVKQKYGIKRRKKPRPLSEFLSDFVTTANLVNHPFSIIFGIVSIRIVNKTKKVNKIKKEQIRE